ncbi:MAG: cytochrome b N-terminal domain-containing protein [Desulfatiglandaceae bacterium]
MSADRIILKLSGSLPRIGLSTLMVCLFSGIVLSFYYRPAGDVFRNVEEITTHVPFGWFFRQLHYAAGQLFVILMLLHTLDHFLKRRYAAYPLRVWIHLILAVLLSLFTLFTGFILKGDKEALFAGRIFTHILQAVPMVGDPLSRIFITSGQDFFFLPYLYHCFFLPLLIIYLIRNHIREWIPDKGFMMAGVVGLFLYAFLVKPSPAVPPGAMMETVKGPWFFLGIQALLKFVPPLLGAIVLPGLFVACVLILPLSKRKNTEASFSGRIFRTKGDWLRYGVIFLFVIYVGLTVKAWLWGV